MARKRTDRNEGTPSRHDIKFEPPRLQYRPPLYVRECKSGNFEMRFSELGMSPHRQMRGRVAAVVGIAGEAAVAQLRRRGVNLRAVLTMAQVIDGKVTKLVTRAGQLLARI